MITRDNFVAKWRSAIRPVMLTNPALTKRARQNFEADLDTLLETARAEEREDTLSDGDAMREVLKGSRW